MVTLDIDGRTVKVPRGTSVLEAAEQLGIQIPTLCHYKELTPYGACRVCTVEVIRNGRSRLQSSCSLPAEDGMVVVTDSERVLRGRQMIVELLYARCPGVTAIQNLAEQMGIKKIRFKMKKEDCILCGLCVEVCNEIVGVGALGFSSRGITRKIDTPFGEPSEACLGCGACTYVCPTGAIQMEAEAVKRFLERPASERYCRYMRMGLISHKVCPRNYQCWRCPVDQSMEEIYGIHPAFVVKPAKAKEPIQIDEFLLKPDYYYYHGHVWVKPMEDRVRIGIDDFARKLVGHVDDLKTAKCGTSAGPGEFAWELICGNKQARMLFPLEGTITEINPWVEDDPSLLRKDPYGRGWIYDIQPTNLEKDLNRLLMRSTARNWLKTEADKLHRWMAATQHVIITDGGFLRSDLPDQLTDTEWANLTKEFFLS